ncbi:MAG: TIGR03643 family protein [Lewinellaceae bacterium]|nr:TIGR03643 family protein [Lewinellaceae bacterium]
MKKRLVEHSLRPEDIDRIIEMAWEDRTPFEAIEVQFGLKEADVIRLMQQEMHPRNWKKWRARVQGRTTKHQQLRQDDVLRFKSRMQRTISGNRKSK